MCSTSFLGFSCPNLLFVFLNLFFKEPVTYFFASVGTFSGSAYEHGNSFLCLEE